jgi:anti-sigma factor RsiW
MMRWRCRPYPALLVDAVDGTLSARARERLDAHLQGCAACRADLAALQDVAAQLRLPAVPDPGEAFWTQQRHTIGQAIGQAGPREAPGFDGWRAVWPPPPWRALAAVATSIAVALIMYRAMEQAQHPTPPPISVHVAALDTDALLALRDIAPVVGAAEDDLLLSPLGEEPVVLALPLAELTGVRVPVQIPRAADLTDAELEGADSLLGTVG